jgi:hypothetical protein
MQFAPATGTLNLVETRGRVKGEPFKRLSAQFLHKKQGIYHNGNGGTRRKKMKVFRRAPLLPS